MTAKSHARIYRGTPHNIELLANALRRGELVGVPTETVYGLAADAMNPKACRAIFTAKGRPTEDPLIVHIHALTQLSGVAIPNEAALKLAKACWPGPLTIVLPKQATVPGIVSAGLPSVAVRMPSHPLFRRLLKRCKTPLAAPSANLFGYVSPTSAAHVAAGLGTRIKYILDGGSSRIGVESTIIDLRDPAAPHLLRPGAVTRDELERVLGIPITTSKRHRNRRAQVSPGLLKRHYSPRTPSTVHDQLSLADALNASPKEAWLFVTKPRGAVRKNVFWLDARGNLAGAARRLFATLRSIDAAGFSLIHLERAQGGGLAEAINDRLQRAAGKG
jgi:L-threonylcarbamoyladenylate synthase